MRIKLLPKDFPMVVNVSYQERGKLIRKKYQNPGKEGGLETILRS